MDWLTVKVVLELVAERIIGPMSGCGSGAVRSKMLSDTDAVVLAMKSTIELPLATSVSAVALPASDGSGIAPSNVLPASWGLPPSDALPPS